jgi:hypothetical protein
MPSRIGRVTEAVRILKQVPAYARFAAGLASFLRHPISLADAETLVRQGLERREDNFLRLLERGVFGRTRSPYARLMKLARCEMGDVREMVRRRGLEASLRALREAGVYVTFDEMKGREPIVRHGDAFAVTTDDFSNPLLRPAYEGETSGTTGVSTRVSQDLDHLATQSAHLMLAYHAHGALGAVFGVWRGVLPDGSGMNNVLRSAHHGRIAAKWFVPSPRGGPKPAWRFQLVTYWTVIAGRLLGVPLPWPEVVPIDQAIIVAKWAAAMVKAHGACHLSVSVSRALRVCVAAQEAGIDLKGTVFVIAGEPPSPAKVAGIRAAGARCFPTYGFVEAGRVAIGCVNPSTSNDLHILSDAFEVLPYERGVPGTDVRVNALNITSLLLTTPQILLNAEVDDYGIVEDRACGCPLQRFGYQRHVRDIHSYRKLTGEGVTLVGGDMIDIMERVLPAKFGGSPLDYQLMEEEDERGFTRLTLIVSPRVQIQSESVVIDEVMHALRASSLMADTARSIWVQAGTMRVQRREPIWTGRGKLMPLHLARRSAKASATPGLPQ